jgi:hypothetical protein
VRIVAAGEWACGTKGLAVGVNSEEPIERMLVAIDPWVMVLLSGTAVVAWLALRTCVAIATGYIKLGRRGPAHRSRRNANRA